MLNDYDWWWGCSFYWSFLVMNQGLRKNDFPNVICWCEYHLCPLASSMNISYLHHTSWLSLWNMKSEFLGNGFWVIFHLIIASIVKCFIKMCHYHQAPNLSIFMLWKIWDNQVAAFISLGDLAKCCCCCCCWWWRWCWWWWRWWWLCWWWSNGCVHPTGPTWPNGPLPFHVLIWQDPKNEITH